MSSPSDPGRVLARVDVERLSGPVVLEFGASWCGYCHAMAPLLAAQLGRFPQVRHIQIEDGKGKPLGRSFRVKLWPTLVFLHNGQVMSQVARPSAAQIQQGLESIAGND